jgi:hypothetical protein
MAPSLFSVWQTAIVCMTSLLSFLFGRAESTCYYPGGQIVAADHTPCTNDTTFTHCCADKQACLSNGWCLVTYDMTIWMGSCTDPTWSAVECFQEESCQSSKSDTILTIYTADFLVLTLNFNSSKQWVVKQFTKSLALLGGCDPICLWKQ